MNDVSTLVPSIRCREVRYRVSGFSLLELVVVIALIGTLIGVAINRLLPYIDEAERVAVLRVEGQLRSTLTMEAAERIVRGQAASLVELEGANPIKFLLEPPKNYVGELAPAEVGRAPERHWYFERDRRQLVYRLGEPYGIARRGAALQDPAFAVRVAFADADRDGVFEPRQDELYGVRLQRLAGEEWLAGVTRR